MLEDNSILQNRYRISKKLGQGGMGAVYLANDTKFGSLVAVKETLIPDNPECRESFLREANLLNSLRHQALSHVIDYFAYDSEQYLVMQYIEGKTLDSVLYTQLNSQKEPLSSEQVVGWVKQILEALDYLHSNKPSVLHQDIKPQNLMLTATGKIVLLDFGLARIQVPDTGDYVSMAACTPPYASWEQLNNDGIDQRSDLFSLAATAYHLLAGELPPNAQLRMFSVVKGESDPLQKLNTVNFRVPEYIAEVLHSALALHKEKRPSTANQMLDMLNRADDITT